MEPLPCNRLCCCCSCGAARTCFLVLDGPNGFVDAWPYCGPCSTGWASLAGLNLAGLTYSVTRTLPHR